MPNNYINSLVDRGVGTKAELEKHWRHAKRQAAKESHKNDYDYITSIFNRMIGLEEATTTAAIATYPMGGGDAASNAGLKKKKKKKNAATFADFYYDLGLDS